MKIYETKLVKKENIFERIFFSIKKLTNEYERKILVGFNALNFSKNKLEELTSCIKKLDIKVFLAKDFPPCVFSFVSKYKMCDIGINLEYKNGDFYIIIFSANGYPICSYQKRCFLENMENYTLQEEKNLGEIFNLKLDLSINQYIKSIFKSHSKKITFIKNVYDIFYFKVNGNYYVLDKYFCKILNKSDDKILEKLKNFCTKEYLYKNDDKEFDVYKYILSRKIACIKLLDGSIIFDDSYYIDYLKIIYYLEFLC